MGAAVNPNDSGHFADATPQQLADLLSILDYLDDPKTERLLEWARGKRNFHAGNIRNIDYYVTAAKRRAKRLRQ